MINGPKSSLSALRAQTMQAYSNSQSIQSQMAGLQRDSLNCNSQLSSARTAISPALYDNYERDSSASGAEAGSILKGLGGGVSGLKQGTDSIRQGVWTGKTDLQNLNRSLQALAPQVPPGPAQVAVSAALRELSLAQQSQVGAAYPIENANLSRASQLIEIANSQATEIASESSKTPKVVAPAAVRAYGCLGEIGLQLISLSSGAMSSNQNQIKISGAIHRTADYLGQAIALL